jgi:hypothetical protein
VKSTLYQSCLHVPPRDDYSFRGNSFRGVYKKAQKKKPERRGSGLRVVPLLFNEAIVVLPGSLSALGCSCRLLQLVVRILQSAIRGLKGLIADALHRRAIRVLDLEPPL